MGTGGPLVAARAAIELPDPDAVPLVVRTWVPVAEPIEHHSPYCRSRCCGTLHLILPTPTPVPLAGRGGQAPTLPRPRRTQLPPAVVVKGSAAALAAAQTGRPVPCAGGCGARVSAAYVLATGRDWHGCCPAPVEAGATSAAVVSGGAR
jgi:hypothetical protein